MFYSERFQLVSFLVGLVDQVFQAALNVVEQFFLFDLCLSFCAALSFTSVRRCSFNRHRFLVSAVDHFFANFAHKNLKCSSGPHEEIL